MTNTSSLHPFSVAIAGCGKMGSAMVRAWINDPLIRSIDILDPTPLPADLHDNPKLYAYQNAADFMARCNGWSLLVLAVKPQIMADICILLSSALPDGLPMVSIAAGKTIVFFESALGASRPIIRAMPNLPGAIGRGITVACGNAALNDHSKGRALHALGALGLVRWVDDETLMDAVTAISGSGPAYLFYLTECLAQAAKNVGLPDSLAHDLARQTITGSAALMDMNEPLSPAQLRADVTSPNGTTAAALSILMDGRWQDILNEAVEKARARSRELSK